MGQLVTLKPVIFVPVVGNSTATEGAVVPMLNQRESSVVLPKPSECTAEIPTLPCGALDRSTVVANPLFTHGRVAFTTPLSTTLRPPWPQVPATKTLPAVLILIHEPGAGLVKLSPGAEAVLL